MDSFIEPYQIIIVCGRSIRFDPNINNKYTQHIDRYNIREKLEKICVDNKVNLALRGESYGRGIQGKAHNPHAQLDPGLAIFSVYLIDEMVYARLDHQFYFARLCEDLDLPMVPIIERTILKESTIKYYDTLEKLRGSFFEGVVVNGKDFSFKIINKEYDSK